ncbi:MAG: hypothetical protein FJX23_05985 [Alphaproteobacteria bacterium]|nr:hypothetical protein [Alphaproteobacteria bacterium]
MRKLQMLALCFGLAVTVGGCAKLAGGKHITTLEKAIEVQKNDTSRAIVLGTVEIEKEDGEGFTQAVSSFLVGGDSTQEGVRFGGSPVPNANAEKAKELIKDSRIPAYSLMDFAISSVRSWALVYPQKYAVYSFLDDKAHSANIGAWGRKDRKAYMVFDVNPGEIVYIGNIKYRFVENQYVSVKIEDKFELFKAEIPEEIRGRVVKRIIKSPPVLYPESMKKVPVPRSTVIVIPKYR